MTAKYMTADSTRPAHRMSAVTPSNVTVLEVTRGLYVGTGGSILVTPVDGDTTVSFKNVADGTILPLQVTKVWNTGTTATDIVALY